MPLLILKVKVNITWWCLVDQYNKRHREDVNTPSRRRRRKAANWRSRPRVREFHEGEEK